MKIDVLKIPFAGIAAILAGSVVFHPGPIASAAEDVLAVQNVCLFDGERVIPSANVIVRGGLIAAAGPGMAIPGGAEIMDGRGKMLLPGLIDAHVHVWTTDNLKQCPVFGVTTVVDMFMNTTLLKAVKTSQFSAHPPLQAFLVSPGIMATVAGGHGTQFGFAIPTIAAETDLQAFVDARIAEGADFIKITQDDFSAYGMTRPTLSNERVAGLIRAAHRRGKIAVIHAATLKNCQDALAAGVDGLAHLYFENKSDPEFGARAAKAKAFVIPTLSVLRALNGLGCAPGLIDDPDLKPYLKPDDVQGFRAKSPATSAPGSYEAAEAALRRLKAAGIPILAGTDTPNPGTAFGAALHGELELLVNAGLTPLEALRAATSLPADKFSIAGRGRIRPGAAADLVLVDGDPTAEIKATRKIVAVWKSGTRIDREGYRQAVRAAERSFQKIPIPEYGASGLIADFEDGKISSAFGAGWMISTDAFRGGKSEAQMMWSEGGAVGSRGAMKIGGEIRDGFAFPWAGAAFSPGTSSNAPANLSAKSGIAFWAKGDARRYAVEVFTRGKGFMPAMKVFMAGPEWKEYAITFEELGIDGSDVMMIFFGAVQDPGPFTLFVDEIRLK